MSTRSEMKDRLLLTTEVNWVRIRRIQRLRVSNGGEKEFPEVVKAGGLIQKISIGYAPISTIQRMILIGIFGMSREEIIDFILTDRGR